MAQPPSPPPACPPHCPRTECCTCPPWPVAPPTGFTSSARTRRAGGSPATPCTSPQVCCLCSRSSADLYLSGVPATLSPALLPARHRQGIASMDKTNMGVLTTRQARQGKDPHLTMGKPMFSESARPFFESLNKKSIWPHFGCKQNSYRCP